MKAPHRSFCKGLLTISSISFSFFLLYFIHFLFTPIIRHQDHIYLLNPGTSALQFSHDLAQQTALKSPLLFLGCIKLLHVEKRLQSGEYLFEINSTPLHILYKIIHGDILYHTFTIVEGWTYAQVMVAIQNNQSIQKTLSKDLPETIAKKLGLNTITPEGHLMPDTYYYPSGITDLALLKQAVQTMNSYLEKAWALRDPTLIYKNPEQVLIVASMIEKETADIKEKPMIAAVIFNRLRHNIPLQIDATVIYGLGPSFSGQLTKNHLQIKNPYNTYKRYGLPPTPISMPSRESIEAALHPASTTALYFVSKGNGSHQFSHNLNNHYQAVQNYHAVYLPSEHS